MTSSSSKELRTKLFGYGAKAVKIGSNLADVLVHVTTKPTALTALSVAARAIESFREVTATNSDAFFSKWHHCRSLSSLSDFILAHLSHHDLVRVHSASEQQGARILVAEVHGKKIGWARQDAWVQGPWVPEGEDEASTLVALGRFLWESMGTALIAKKNLYGNDYLEVDPLKEVHESKDAVDLFETLTPFLRKGHARSVLLYGEPGTGKSHVMKHVARLAGGMSLRITARDLASLSSISSVIKLLRPSAVLIDDLDRIESPDDILSEVEIVRGSSGLLMVSVNRLSRMDPAVLRPRRFDEVVHITRLDPSVIDVMIGSDVPPHVCEQLRDLPVAYINEFHLRRDVLGTEAALASVTALVERNDMIRKMCSAEEESPRFKAPALKSSVG